MASLINSIETQTLQYQLPNFPQDLFYESSVDLLRTFTCFPELPFELRLKIWHQAFPPKRTINLVPDPEPQERNKQNYWCNCNHASRCIHHPITLFINQESRIETLKFYRLLSRDRWFHRPVMLDLCTLEREEVPPRGRLVHKVWHDKKPPLYFSPVHDELYIELNDLRGHVNYLLFESLQGNSPGCFDGVKVVEVRDLELRTVDFLQDCVYRHSSVRVVRLFPDLEIVRVVLGDCFQGLSGEKLQTSLMGWDPGHVVGSGEDITILKNWFHWLFGGNGGMKGIHWSACVGIIGEECPVLGVEERNVPRIELCYFDNESQA